MEKNRIKYLYQKYIADTCSEEELAELQSLVSSGKQNKDLAALLDETWRGMESGELKDLNPQEAHLIFQEIVAKPRQINGPKRLFWKSMAAAVLAVIALSVGVVYFLNVGNDGHQLATEMKAILPDAEPGSNKAILLLDNGGRIDLNENKEGIMVVGENEWVYADGTQLTDGQKLKATTEATLSTPKGGQYQVVLSDGTKVWLNSASSLKYPVVFGAEQRVVVLSGEAYFEVAPASSPAGNGGGWPFIVNTDQQQVEVLGTHFNISAYRDDRETKTTLVEGKVRVSRQGLYKEGKPSSVILNPGQQSIIRYDSQHISHANINIFEEISWKDGIFIFGDEPIRNIMRRLSRWYNVEIDYRGNVDDIKFFGNYSRDKSLQNLLKNMELTGKVRFEMYENAKKERRITVIAN